MKKTIAYVLALSVILLTLASCGAANGDPPENTGEPPPTTVSPSPNPDMPLPEYPVIDGSSSTIFMNLAIRMYLTDDFVTYNSVQHSQTYEALERLIPGSANPADMLLAVRYYDETLEDAAARGAELVITPVAKEGFVFITHADNPVDSLTQEQLRGIYSGGITNWSEVGGLDEEIILFTRNWDSGSQTAMAEFMGDLPIVESTAELSGMGGMLESVAMNGSAAIGFNIYSWSMQQAVDDWEALKFLAVDGVAPSNGTLADDSYPLRVYTYSYYNEGNGKAKALTDWLLTDEGQRVIVSVGYTGVFGEYSTELPKYPLDENDAIMAVDAYYHENQLYDTYGSPAFKELITDPAAVGPLADGKGKAVTAAWIVRFYDRYGYPEIGLRYIVVTRERGGEFEVIAEGEVASYENGVIVPR